MHARALALVLVAASGSVSGCRQPPTHVLLPTPVPSAGDSLPSPAASVAAAGAVAPEPRIPVLVEETERGALLSTPSYRIHCTLPDTRLRSLLPVFMERALENYRSAIAELPEPPIPMESEVFRTRGEWVDFTNADLGDAAAMYTQIGRGGYTREGRSVLYDLGYTDTLTIAAHEGWHQYAQSTFTEALPPWLDEGMATYCEGCTGLRSGAEPTFLPWRNLERYGALREAVHADAIRPLEAVVCGTPQGFLLEGRDALLDYYAHVWALLHFLAEHDDGSLRPGLERLLLDAAHGRVRARGNGPRAIARQFEAYFGASPRELDAEYRDFVRAITARGAGNAIYQGRSPLAR